MSSGATAGDIRIGEPASTPVRPSSGIRNIDPAEVTLAYARHAARYDLEPRPATGPLVIDVDEEGGYIVSDLIGAVYGSGASSGEALVDYFVALDEHLDYLRAHADELHPRLERQLSMLQRLFPGR